VITAQGTHAHMLASQPRYRELMSGADGQPADAQARVMTADTWRGIAAEDADQITGKLSALLRRRARHLLTSLLRPHRRRVMITFALIITANLAALAGPWLVGLAIDLGLPR